jgi:ankyrin repeat protein
MKSSQNNELFDAIQSNDGRLVRRLLRHGANVNIADNGGMTPLMIASQNGDIEIVDLLLSHHADVNAYNNTRPNFPLTALIYAIKNHHLDIAQILVDTGANVNNPPSLTHALEYRYSLSNIDKKTIEFLIKNKANVNLPVKYPPLEQLIENMESLLVHKDSLQFPNEIETARLLIKHGADVNHKIDFESNKDYQQNTWTLLMLACDSNNVEMVRLLLDNDADFTMKDRHGKTALRIILEGGDRPYLRPILTMGPWYENIVGEGPQTLKQMFGVERLAMAILLIDKYFDKGMTFSNEELNHELVKYLVERKRAECARKAAIVFLGLQRKERLPPAMLQKDTARIISKMILDSYRDEAWDEAWDEARDNHSAHSLEDEYESRKSKRQKSKRQKSKRRQTTRRKTTRRKTTIRAGVQRGFESKPDQGGRSSTNLKGGKRCSRCFKKHQ